MPYVIKEKWILLLISFFLLLNINGSSPLYYLGIFGMLLVIANKYRKSYCNKYVLVFLLVGICSILINNVPSSLSPYSRFLVYCLVIVIFGPLFQNHSLSRLRWIVLCNLLNLFMVITCLSFVLMLLGIVPLLNTKEQSGGFAGITSSSMLMAPIAALAILYGIYGIMKGQMKKLRITGVVIAVPVLMLTGSRAALVGFVAAVFLFFIMYYHKKPRILLLYSFFAMLTLTVSFPLWRPALAVIEKKNEIQEEMEGENSRTTKWGNRIYEFKNNPVFGVGLFSVDLKRSKADISDTGNIEYGSSWFALLATTGIVGFLSIICLFIKSVCTVWRSYHDILLKSFMCAVALFFIIHLIFEGYMFGIGNVLNIVLWLSLSGMIASSSFNAKSFE